MEGNASITASATRSDPISETVFYMASVVWRVCVDPPLCLCSIVLNIINCLVFYRVGLKDGVTAIFMLISISDCLLGFFGTVGGICSTVRYLGPHSVRRSAKTIYTFVLFFIGTTSNVSMYATLDIAVVRWFSVAMPLSVKTVMTTRRQLLAILFLSITSFFAKAFALSNFRVVPVLDPTTNVTQLELVLSPNFRERVAVLDGHQSVTFSLSFVIMAVCLFLLLVALKRSSKFLSQGLTDASNNQDRPTPSVFARRARRREAQVIKVVVLVIAVFLVCNLPIVVLSIIRLIIPEFRRYGNLGRSFEMLFMLGEMAYYINSSVNIFIYYFCNSNYRKVFKLMFGRE
ncbi:chemosensory receptor c [Plakobranchus ocellatus]|uniref:Chemosensory receptor c n=1 Tax=Plakobranchus ocellatus TaxID=259542 RepID=A0AAV4ACP6_9GAST|nr:chemosensory receptor c [Plakobranchus ocellatus]